MEVCWKRIPLKRWFVSVVLCSSLAAHVKACVYEDIGDRSLMVTGSVGGVAVDLQVKSG